MTDLSDFINKFRVLIEVFVLFYLNLISKYQVHINGVLENVSFNLFSFKVSGSSYLSIFISCTL